MGTGPRPINCSGLSSHIGCSVNVQHNIMQANFFPVDGFQSRFDQNGSLYIMLNLHTATYVGT